MPFEATAVASRRKTPNARVADQKTLNRVNYNYFDAFVPTGGSGEAWSFFLRIIVRNQDLLPPKKRLHTMLSGFLFHHFCFVFNKSDVTYAYQKCHRARR